MFVSPEPFQIYSPRLTLILITFIQAQQMGVASLYIHDDPIPLYKYSSLKNYLARDHVTLPHRTIINFHDAVIKAQCQPPQLQGWFTNTDFVVKQRRPSPEAMMHFPLFQIPPLFAKKFQTPRKIFPISPIPKSVLIFIRQNF